MKLSLKTLLSLVAVVILITAISIPVFATGFDFDTAIT